MTKDRLTILSGFIISFSWLRIDLIADFVADDTTDGGTANGSDRTAAGKHGTTNGTDSSTNGGVFILGRHVGAPSQAEQHGCGNGGACVTLYYFHGTASF
jgi:hypothetical protein